MQMLTPSQGKDLQQLLDKAINASQSLLQLLQNEKDILRQHDPFPLEKLMKEKSPLIQVLTQLSQHIQQYLPVESAKDFPQIIAGCDPHISQNLLSLWTELKQITHECQDTNAINGRAIATSLQHAKQLSRLLQGKPETGLTYNQQGVL